MPNFSPPPPAQRVANTNATLPLSSNEAQPTLRSFDAERKRQERAKKMSSKRLDVLLMLRLRTVSARQNEDESQRKKRLADDRQQKEATRATESTAKTNERIQSISVRRRQRSLETRIERNPIVSTGPELFQLNRKTNVFKISSTKHPCRC